MRKTLTRATFLLGVAGAALLATRRGAAQSARPNVLWIFDDDHPQYMMKPMPVTRNKIRDGGIEFARGHVDIPLCGPSRVGVLTGLSVTTHDCDTNHTWPQFEASPLGLEDRTAARYLREVGYATGHFGKYINDHYSGEPHVPLHWDRWCEVPGGRKEDPGNPDFANLDGETVELPKNMRPTEWSARRTADFIRKRAGSPWFAQYCPTNPHQPYHPTTESEHLFDGAERKVPSVNEGDMSDKPRWMRDLPRVDRDVLQKEIEGKSEELADLDKLGIKPILKALADTGQLANTLIFFGSDNGYSNGEHRLLKKDKPYWESSEVPFFAKGAGVASGLKRNALVSTVDWMPTTCEAAGVPPEALDVDGRSMLTNLGSGAFPVWRKRMLVTGSDDVGPEENPGGSNDPSGRWWLLREGEKAFILRENGEKELYRMGTDPHQLKDRTPDIDEATKERLVRTVEAMRQASGEERRRLEGASTSELSAML